MVPKSGTRLPRSPNSVSDSELAVLIGKALQDDLGGSRRAAKTIMAWTGVSDHSARAWLNGHKSPSSAHLLALAARSKPVMATVLGLTGHPTMTLLVDLEAIECRLEAMLAVARQMRSPDQ